MTWNLNAKPSRWDIYDQSAFEREFLRVLAPAFHKWYLAVAEDGYTKYLEAAGDSLVGRVASIIGNIDFKDEHEEDILFTFFSGPLIMETVTEEAVESGLSPRETVNHEINNLLGYWDEVCKLLGVTRSQRS